MYLTREDETTWYYPSADRDPKTYFSEELVLEICLRATRVGGQKTRFDTGVSLASTASSSDICFLKIRACQLDFIVQIDQSIDCLKTLRGHRRL